LITLELSDPRWREFTRRCPAATPFHHPAWAALLARSYGFRAFALGQQDTDGRLLAGIPVVEVRGPLRDRRWVSLPFTDHCSPLTVPGGGVTDLHKELDVARFEAGVPSFEVRTSLDDQVADLQTAGVLHLLDLEPDAEAVRRRVRPSVRKWIDRARRDGVTVRHGDARADLTRTFYDLHVRTRRRQGVPVQPRRYFELLWDQMLAPGLGFVLLASSGDTAIAGAVFLAWNGTAIYKYGASDTRHWDLHPNHLVMWEAIRRACENGQHTFDFGRSHSAGRGLRQFKSSWGAREAPLTYSTLGRRGSSLSSDGHLYDLLGMTIRNSPPAVCRLLGQLLYRFAA
jgi:CelD/BcsL family acetyltransferase involved in cellulose biosynthesis